jgi:hypothetical protein
MAIRGSRRDRVADRRRGAPVDQEDNVRGHIEPAREALTSALDKALGVEQTLVDAYLRRARRGRPDATPAEVIASLERQYLAAVSALGAAGGATAAVPGVALPAALVTNVVEVAAFLQASVVFALAYADVHGVQVDDLERRRTLVTAILLGNSGSAVVRQVAGRTGPHWGRAITRAIPMSSINAVNKVLGRHFVTKYGTKQGILVLGRQLPFGLGAAIGAGGNAALGRAAVVAARRAFGPPPAEFPPPVTEEAHA